MPDPNAPVHRGRIGSCDLLLLGTIAGFEPDADRVKEAFEGHDPEAVALGVPPEDLEGLETLAAPDADLKELLPEPAREDERLFSLLERWGPSRIPSPDLEVAYAAATGAEVPLVALDMDDNTHSTLYIKTVGFRTVVRSGRINKKLLKQEFTEATDAWDLVRRWDAFQNKLKQLATVEAAREAHMAQRLVEEAKERSRLLAIVPAARFDGVVAALADAL
ncbi:MAG: hypothetical protein ACPGQL_06055 [Thermoplasmatota archaeon]